MMKKRRGNRYRIEFWNNPPLRHWVVYDAWTKGNPLADLYSESRSEARAKALKMNTAERIKSGSALVWDSGEREG